MPTSIAVLGQSPAVPLAAAVPATATAAVSYSYPTIVGSSYATIPAYTAIVAIPYSYRTTSVPVLLNLTWGKSFLPGDAYPMAESS
jgi:hypothetical protein